MPQIKIRTFHMCGAIGGGAKGFQRAQARLGNLTASCETLGSVDVDAAACRDFKRITGVEATVLDLFDRGQYVDWHGHEPPANWREATPADVRRAAQNRRPHIIFTSPPCKGFSGLLPQGKASTDKYQALNRLTLRTVWLALEAWSDDPPEFFLLENVPLIMTRGRHLLDQIISLLAQYGYAVRETKHDCGELGGLAQSRRRFLLVARHQEKVPPFLYEPVSRPLRAVGTVLDRCPLPGDVEAAGPMHRVPTLQWKTWVRLAFVEAGSDWRSLRRLDVAANGTLRDFCIVPERYYNHGVLGVQRWDEPSGCVAGASRPGNGNFSVADPRFGQSGLWNDGQQYGVRRWQDSTGAVTGQPNPGQGSFSVADPRCAQTKHNNCFRVVPFHAAAGTVTGGGHPSSGGQCVADPRPKAGPLFSKYKVTRWTQNTGTVIGGDDQGAYAVADPRPALHRAADHYQTAGHYGVVPYDASSYAVTGAACHDNGHWSVADPRIPAASDKVTAVIRALDGTWHRPFTTFELAALQSLIDPQEQLELDGLSDQAWRERIGNAVPPDAAQAIAEVMFRTLLAAWSGETFLISNEPVWVRPVAAAIALPGHHHN